jgi:hypothetical protein
MALWNFNICPYVKQLLSCMPASLLFNFRDH